MPELALKEYLKGTTKNPMCYSVSCPLLYGLTVFKPNDGRLRHSVVFYSENCRITFIWIIQALDWTQNGRRNWH